MSPDLQPHQAAGPFHRQADHDGRNRLTCRVAPRHFSDVPGFVHESHRVLKPGGYLMIIDGSVPDADTDPADWLYRVEKLRDPSHGRLLDRLTWIHLVGTPASPSGTPTSSRTWNGTSKPPGSPPPGPRSQPAYPRGDAALNR